MPAWYSFNTASYPLIIAVAELQIISYFGQASKHEASLGNAKTHNKPFSLLEVKISKLSHRHAPTSMPDSGADLAT